MVANNPRNKPDHSLPAIGIWNCTASVDPTAGNTLVGLWVEEGQKIAFFCAYFRNAQGDCVDPDEDAWDEITFHSRQGDQATVDDPEIPPPDYWAEARWIIPGWGGV
jgi:hypothetical protein